MTFSKVKPPSFNDRTKNRAIRRRIAGAWVPALVHDLHGRDVPSHQEVHTRIHTTYLLYL
jgi:hypothetical protein